MKDIKLDEDIFNMLKEKYDQIVVPDRIFDTSKIFERVEQERKKSKKRKFK